MRQSQKRRAQGVGSDLGLSRHNGSLLSWPQAADPHSPRGWSAPCRLSLAKLLVPQGNVSFGTCAECLCSEQEGPEGRAGTEHLFQSDSF